MVPCLVAVASTIVASVPPTITVHKHGHILRSHTHTQQRHHQVHKKGRVVVLRNPRDFSRLMLLFCPQEPVAAR